MSARGNNKQVTGVMKNNLKNLSNQMVRMKNSKKSHQSSVNEFDTIPDALSSTSRGDIPYRGLNNPNSHLTSPTGPEAPINDQNEHHSERFDPLFSQYTEYNIPIEDAAEDSQTGDLLYKYKSDEPIEERVSEIPDELEIVQKNNYYEEKAINPNDFWTKPFVVISVNNNLETFSKGDDTVSVQSLMQLEADQIFSPKKKELSKVGILGTIAEENYDLNKAFHTYLTDIQANYKEIYLQQTYGQLKKYPQQYAKVDSPSKTFIKYNQNVPFTEEERSVPVTPRPGDARFTSRSIYSGKYQSPIPQDMHASTSNYLSSPANVRKSPGFGGKQGERSPGRAGYGDSVDIIASRMQRMIEEMQDHENRGNKKNFLLLLKHFDVSFSCFLC